jgi:hypothetical protein
MLHVAVLINSVVNAIVLCVIMLIATWQSVVASSFGLKSN